MMHESDKELQVITAKQVKGYLVSISELFPTKAADLQATYKACLQDKLIPGQTYKQLHMSVSDWIYYGN